MSEALDSLQSQVDEWVAELLSDFQLPTDARRKIVRDAVHGYITLEPHEVAIVDSPLVQRLRYIHQTALAYLVYPSARHTRFEHSLGVLQAVDNMVAGLRRNGFEQLADDGMLRELRAAAILHDIGHVFFSHLGESILAERFGDQFEQIKVEAEPRFARANAGEILAYVMITGEPFRKYLEDVATAYSVDMDVMKMAAYIVGDAPSDQERYKTDIINGPFDADKLDYLLRDCHFCGIKADVDVERFYQTLGVWEAGGTPRYLVMQQSGIPILEQILFSKMMLYTAIYHHQKIRALECMVRGVIYTAWEHPATIKNEQLRFQTIGDFLRVNEFDFFSQGLEEAALQPMIQNILNRRLLKRALTISMQSVSGDTQQKMFALDTIKTREPGELLQLRQTVFDAIEEQHQTSLVSLWVDLPSGPDLNEAAMHCFVDTGEEQPKALAEMFPTDDWLTSYEQNKWHGHVYYEDDDEKRRGAARAAEQVFKEDYGVSLLPTARSLSKVSLD